MHLNTLVRRSYNDLMQYPIFPRVLADYESEVSHWSLLTVIDFRTWSCWKFTIVINQVLISLTHHLYMGKYASTFTENFSPEILNSNSTLKGSADIHRTLRSLPTNGCHDSHMSFVQLPCNPPSRNAFWTVSTVPVWHSTHSDNPQSLNAFSTMVIEPFKFPWLYKGKRCT